MQLGPYSLKNRWFVAPMAGVTDRPFRQLCRRLGAGYAVSEMVTSRKELWHSLKTSKRLDHAGEPAPIAVQIAGTEVEMVREAALFNMDRGAQIIDINMGCPAKKVCNKWAGAALMQNEPLAEKMVAEVVAVCAPRGVPVTLKMRTGWDDANKNALRLAKIFERCGVAMLTIHGRTREMGYKGVAEYDTVRAIKAAVSIPVVANGDINSPQKAKMVLDYTQADAIMIGREAQGRPWIFDDIDCFMRTGEAARARPVATVKDWLLEHLEDHYSLHGEHNGVLSARKHIGWYLKPLVAAVDFKKTLYGIEDCKRQLQAVDEFLSELSKSIAYWPN